MSAAEKRCVRVFLRQATTPRQIKNKDNQLGVQNQIKFAQLVADATSDPFPRGKWTSAGRGKGLNVRTNFISATLIFINLFTR